MRKWHCFVGTKNNIVTNDCLNLCGTARSALLLFSTLCYERLLKCLGATQWKAYGTDKTGLSDPKFDK